MSHKKLFSRLAVAGTFAAIVMAAPRDFVPDFVFKGSSLTGFRTIGPAEWKAANGEITATPRNGGGGWLVFDKGYQDIELNTEFFCGAKCDVGLLLRADKTSDGGLKGLYVSLTDGDVETYEITVGPDGKETSRKRLERATGNFTRIAAGPWNGGSAKAPGFAELAQTVAEQREAAARPPAPPATAAAGAAGRGGGRGGIPQPGLKANDWNSIDVILDMDMATVSLNGRRGLGGATSDRMMGYGPIALRVGGTSDAKFRNISSRDLNPKTEPAEQTSTHFKMQKLNDFLYSWGAAAGDVTHDGVPDVIAGPFYYPGPNYTEHREFTGARSYGPSEFPEGMTYFTWDFKGDGWQDIIVTYSRPVYLFVNPRGQSRRWERYNIIPTANSEIELFRDLDGDGKPEIIFTGPGAVMSFAKPDPTNPTLPWKTFAVSEPGPGLPHGMGVGDVNSDGRMDIVNSRGWWEQPAAGATSGVWKFHAAEFGNGGAEMGVYDVNGDGAADIVTGIAAHGWGLAWFEQKKGANGAESTFVRHNIMGDFSTKNAGDVTFSEPHGAAFADMDGDGIPDLITGKRLYSHLESHLDPDPFGPAVLYWYRTVRNPKAEGGAEFVPELINNHSGVGSQFMVKDLNNDGSPDVVVSAVKGTFIFWNQMKAKKR